MKDFPIRFSFGDVDYVAKVAAFGENSQFHISGFTPVVSDIELPYVIHKKRSGSFAWSATKTLPEEFGQAIFDAIKKTKKFD